MKYPIGIQSFEKIREGGYAYVDKTAYIWRLANEGVYYFLGRPRRFGKSLLISTIEAYFSGQRELFEGLAISGLEQEWATYPILHIDLNTANYKEEGSLQKVLNNELVKWERLYGTEPSETTLALRFKGIVERAAVQTGRNVVVLIDEYDKPLLQTIGDAALQERHRNELKAFYSVLKTQDRYIKFALLTGVTKFGKVSVFSDLNNLTDISMDHRYAGICGITEDELGQYFSASIHEMAVMEGATDEDTHAKLKAWYDGYHFVENAPGVYNPFSLLSAFSKGTFSSYWFETGTPTFLVELLKAFRYRLPDLTQELVSSDVINSVDSTSRNPIPMIYQSGYLTITGYNERFRRYRLGFPNKEVEEGFLNFLLPFYAPVEARSDFDIVEFVGDVEGGQPHRFMERLKALLADADYRVVGDAELYFQNVMYLLFKIMGFYVQVERATSRGRIDAVVETANYVYIFECKLGGSATQALDQIADRDYAAPFAMDPRRLYKIGVNFSAESRGVEEYKVEG